MKNDSELILKACIMTDTTRPNNRVLNSRMWQERLEYELENPNLNKY